MSSRLLARVRDGWSIAGVTLLLCLAIEGTSWLALHARLALVADPRIHADAYGNAPWVDEYYREFAASYRVRWEPLVYWRRPPFAGRYINVDDSGLRVTPQADAATAGKPVTVFLFGGSAMWGTGARDAFTIPALLGSLLHDRGIPARIVNFAESGYVTAQDLAALVVELRRGNRPDVAIFYDGVNDAFSAYQQGVAGLPQNESHRVAEFNLTREDHLGALARTFVRTGISESATARVLAGLAERLGLARPPTSAPDGARTDSSRLAREVSRAYWENVNLVVKLSAGYGIEPYFYWQPTSFEGKPLTPYETVDTDKWQEFGRLFTQVTRDVREQAALDTQEAMFGDLTTTFADRSAPVFLDFAHLSEDGNAVVARRIAEDVAGGLLRRKAASLPAAAAGSS